MCQEDGSRPSGEAIAILQPLESATSNNNQTLQGTELTFTFSNPRASKHQGGDECTKYEYWVNGGVGLSSLGNNCKLCIQLSLNLFSLQR